MILSAQSETRPSEWFDSDEIVLWLADGSTWSLTVRFIGVHRRNHEYGILKVDESRYKVLSDSEVYMTTQLGTEDDATVRIMLFSVSLCTRTGRRPVDKVDAEFAAKFLGRFHEGSELPWHDEQRDSWLHDAHQSQ